MLCLCPNGHEILGTLEKLSARAETQKISKTDKGVEVEYTGDTKIFWDDQLTVVRNGQRVFLCDCGCETLESELVFEKEEGDEEDAAGPAM